MIISVVGTKIWYLKNVQFLSGHPVYRKWQQIRPKLLLMTNRKSHMSFRLTPRLITLDDLDLQ